MFNRWILLFAFAFAISRLASCADYEDNFVGGLSRTCPRDGVPVCGVRGKDYFIFPNQCLLNEVNKDVFLAHRNFKKHPMHQCIHGCRLSCPKDYKPICALNLYTQERKVFVSLCELTKYACKTNMEFVKLKTSDCEPMEILTTLGYTLRKRTSYAKLKPIPCTSIFRPVCGTYLGVKSTFRNECLLNAENIKYGKDWRVVKRGICDEDYSNSRLRLHTKAPKQHSIRKRSYDNRNYAQYQNKNNFRSYKPQMPLDYKTQLEMPNMHRYSNRYTMPQPQIFQTPYHQVNPEPSNMYADDVIQKIMSMPASDNLGTPREADQQYGATNLKPMQFSMNNMAFNYLPAMKDNLEDTLPEPEPSPIDSYEQTNIGKGKYYYPYHQPPPTYDTEEMSKLKGNIEIPVTTTTTMYPPTVEHVMSVPRTIPKEIKQSVKQKTSKKTVECKYGVTPICGVLSNGTVQTFETICEMRTTNLYLKNTWVKLHEGRCERCNHNCSREYEPICVQRNGVNYTMVNDCYFNMAVCIDKISKWNKIADGECQRYTRIPDKYENLQPGFKYTSSYFVSNTTNQMPASTTEIPISSTTTEESAAMTTPTRTNIAEISNEMMRDTAENTNSEPQRTNERTPLLKRVVRRRSSWSPVFPFPNLGPPTESYIMHLVRSKGGLKLSQ